VLCEIPDTVASQGFDKKEEPELKDFVKFNRYRHDVSGELRTA
jgi:hypothetical protein